MKMAYRQIHLDCHTPTLPFDFASEFNKSEFIENLQNAHVNSITLTGRCHHGHIYYDTKLDAKHPNLKFDFLMEAVDACHEVGIRCPIYLTMGWDAFISDRHPEWLEMDKDGKLYGFEDHGKLEPGWKHICFNSEYMDYLIIQIKDTMEHFKGKLDGLFFDILWQNPCYCNSCLRKMKNEGIDPFNDEEVKQYAKTREIRAKQIVTDTIREIDKDCPIFFNEGNITPDIRLNLDNYSHFEIESLASGAWGYQHFPTTVRYVKKLGKPYLGMTGKFHLGWADFGSYKNEKALEYECFLSLAHGAGCSIGDQIYPDGTLSKKSYELIGKVYEKVESLEKYAWDSIPTSQIAILHPGVTNLDEKIDLSLGGAVNMLNELHYQFDIIDDEMDFNQYKLIILPDKIVLKKPLSMKIRKYVNEGGKVFLSYKSGLCNDGEYPDWIPMKNKGISEFNPSYIMFEEEFDKELSKGELVVPAPSLYVETNLNINAKIYSPMYQRNFEHYYGHFHAPIDKETVYPAIASDETFIYCAYPIFEVYRQLEIKMLRDAFASVLCKCEIKPNVSLSNFPHNGDMMFNHQPGENRFVLHLLYYVPIRKGLSLDTIEDVVPLQDIVIKIKKTILKKFMKDAQISQVRQIRDNQNISWENTDDEICFKVKRMEGYEVVVLEYR